MKPAANRAALFVAAALVACGPGHAAGGHHAVDNASILDPGACKIEGWFQRGQDGSSLLHAGTGCRVGPVELTAGADHERQTGDTATGYSLQAKWAAEAAQGLDVGVSVTAETQGRARPLYQGSVVLALVSWAATETVSLHANLGRDLVHGGPDRSRGGVSVEWAARDGWSLMAERYRQQGGDFVRAGIRWSPATDWTMDLSRNHRLHGPSEASWTVGLTREFRR